MYHNFYFPFAIVKGEAKDWLPYPIKKNFTVCELTRIFVCHLNLYECHVLIQIKTPTHQLEAKPVYRYLIKPLLK